jgi:hypothetical protein
VTSAATAGTTLSLAEGRLVALVNPLELDGRGSSHPFDVRGLSTMNCYLLVEDGRALLLGTGYSVHQESLLAQLDELVGGRRLTLVIPRVEFPSMCNARPIADRFPVDVVYQRLPTHPSQFLNFRPGFQPGPGGLRDVTLEPIRPDAPVLLDPAGARRLRFMLPELRLLPSSWAYDDGTRTLFTGDMFSWVWRETPAGPWLLEGDGDDPTTPARVAHFLLRNRYWWLAGGATAALRSAVAEVFDRFEVAVVAPDHGCLLAGGALARHRRLLDDALAAAAELPADGVGAGRWPAGPR